MDDRVTLVKEAYNEARSAWEGFMSLMKEDFDFKMSEQWSSKDLKELNDKGVPALVINLILKNINLVSGYQRQNKPDIRVIPIETSDEYTAEVLSRCIKWIMMDRNGDFTVSDAFKDAIIGGLSWLNPYVDFDHDYLNGDIMLKKESGFGILPDPHFTERDLSDCDYIIRHRRLSKIKLKKLYPKYKKEIEALTGSFADDSGFREDVVVPSDRGNKIMVVEYWYRDYETATVVVNTVDETDSYQWNDSKGDLKMFLDANPLYVSAQKEIPVMKLITIVGDDLITYDGPSPYGGDDFPFIPIFCFYESACADWDKKLQGLVRPLKDLQREKNKRRSQAMQAINTMPNAGWYAEKNAVDDINVLKELGGSQKIVELNPGKMGSVAPIPPPQIPASIVEMERMFSEDMTLVGANPDLLGQILERGAAGITIQLRQKQGLTAIQEVFDSLSYSLRTLGRRMIRYVVENFSEDKIKRILGDDYIYGQRIKDIEKQIKAVVQQQIQIPDMPAPVGEDDEAVFQALSPEGKELMMGQKRDEQMSGIEQSVNAQMKQQQDSIQALKMQLDEVRAEEKEFWDNFDRMRDGARFDCAVDETISSPTYRASILSMLTQLAQYKQPVPFEMILEYMDLPKSAKEKWKNMAAAQQQAQLLQELAVSNMRGAIPGNPQAVTGGTPLETGMNVNV